jgi:chlorite dismutase
MEQVSEAPALDVREHGAPQDGKSQALDRRLFFQLTALSVPRWPGLDWTVECLREQLILRGVDAVIYADVHQPLGLGVVGFSEDVDGLVESLRLVFTSEKLPADLRIRTEYAMLGRTYSSGFEPELAFWLLERPRRTILSEANRYAIWYPLRRKGAFERLPPQQKSAILKEHADLGRKYGDSDLAHDIRLACHGLDVNDNDFIVGLLGRDLHPLSHLVQAMRKTVHTAEYVERMGPFFIGRALQRIANR